MEKKITVLFCRTSQGNEPVRDWLKEISVDDRKTVGSDIKTVEFLWPIGFPQVRKVDSDLWEVRTHISDGRISRVFFTVRGSEMILLHAIIKKTQKTPQEDLRLAKKRRDEILN